MLCIVKKNTAGINYNAGKSTLFLSTSKLSDNVSLITSYTKGIAGLLIQTT